MTTVDVQCYKKGRDNNFNLVRIVSAFSVMVSHSYPLFLGKTEDPLALRTGLSLGYLAVCVFFITSGYLITASVIRTDRAIDFIVSRVVRIYPGLVMCMVLTLFLLGTMPSTTSLLSFDTFIFAIRNMLVVFGIEFEFGGHFSSNPYPSIINGSLWTLPYELYMYMITLLIWLAAPILGRMTPWRVDFRSCVALVVFVTLIGLSITQYFLKIKVEGLFLLLMFFSGSAYRLYGSKLIFSGALVAAIATIFSVSFFTDTNFLISNVFIALMLPYLILAFVYYKNEKLLLFNKLGDYSYGVYIYAFPIQQWVEYAFEEKSFLLKLIASIIGTTLLAVLSWHFVEKPILNKKNEISRSLKRWKF